MSEDRTRIDGIATAVADARELDWEAELKGGSSDPEEQETLRGLYELSRIFRAHRALESSSLSPADVSADLGAANPSAPIRWGPLRIQEALGSGVSGEVFRAHHPELAMDVALKLLHPARASSEELQEGRMLARIRHPNVVRVYGAERHGGRAGIWMELVRGRTLAEVVKQSGPLGAREAALVGIDVCRALAALHGAGLVHRDVKAQNVMREEGGRIVLMDLGAGLSDADSEDAERPVGTPMYMAPEVIDGHRATAASDLYGVGVLLFHLATGSYPFAARSIASLEQIREQGRETLLLDARPSLPEKFVTVVERALNPEPEHRFSSAGVMERELRAVLGEDVGPALPAPSRLHRWLGRRAVTGVMALGSAALTALVTWLLLAPRQLPDPPRNLSLSLDSPMDVKETLSSLTGLLAIAPDGSALAYLGRVGNTRQLLLMRLDGTASAPVSGTEGACSPFFAPDGEWLGFVDGNDVKVVPLRGGAPVTLGSTFTNSRVSWDAENGIVFANAGGIFRAALANREVVRIGAPGEGRVLKDPVFLPGGDAVLLASTGPLLDDSSRVEILSLKTGERRVLVENGGTPEFVPPSAAGGGSHLLFALGGKLFAAPLDVGKLRLKGPAVAVADGVLMRSTGDSAQYTFSRTGVLVYASDEGLSELVWVDEGGRTQRLSEKQRPFAMPRLSPDGSRLAVEVWEVPHQIWLLDIEKDLLSRFTFENSNHFFAWHPDGRSIVYTSDTGEGIQLLWKRVDSAGEPVTVYTGSTEAWITSLSRDGRMAAIQSPVGRTRDAGLPDDDDWDVFLLPLDGAAPPQVSGPPIPMATSQLNERDPWISPDGECVAYVVWEAGSSEVYVSCLEEGGRQQVSTAGGSEPLWSKTGTEVYYRSGNRMMAVDVEREPEFRAGPPRFLFEGSYRHFTLANYDVSDGDRRFVRIRSVAHPSSARHLPIRINWFEELEAKVRPSGR